MEVTERAPGTPSWVDVSSADLSATVELRPVAGCIEMDDNWPPGLPTHWMTYFAVEDCDAMAARAKSLGGTVHVEPTDIPVGRFSVIQDPGGAVCSVIKLTAPM